MTHKFRFHCIAAVALALIACVFTTPAYFLENKTPQVHLKGISIKSIDWWNKTAQTELSILVDNPGPAVKLKELNYRLKLNDQQAAEGKYDKEIELPARARTAVELPCVIDLSSVPGVAWSVISEGFDVRYQFDTEFIVPLFPPI